MNLNLLLSDEEYQKRFAHNNYPTPYVYTLRAGEQVLVYFGTRHSRDLDDVQWAKLKTCWKDFFETAKTKRIIFLEGGKIPQSFEDSWQDAIRKYGESGALVSLSRGTNTEITWPDLSISEEARRLLEKYELSLVAYYIFARSAGSWLRTGTMGTFDEIITKAAVATSHRISEAPSDVKSYAAIHKHIFGNPLDESQKDVLIRASAPVYHDSAVNDVARASSRLRNEHIVIETERYWKDGYSIFLLFGSAHAVIQEPSLRDMIETKSASGIR
jgi:hypothetical protein